MWLVDPLCEFHFRLQHEMVRARVRVEEPEKERHTVSGSFRIRIDLLPSNSHNGGLAPRRDLGWENGEGIT
jgi:hypothetical protein